MRKLESKKIIKQMETKIVCDICGVSYSMDDLRSDEFISIYFTGGYMSNIGDGVGIMLDICDKCFIKRFKKEIDKGIENFKEYNPDIYRIED